MQVFRHAGAAASAFPGGIYAIGNFDGLHLGHQAVLAEAAAQARLHGAPWGVLTFEPHPRQYFAPGAAPFRLTPFRPKMHCLQVLGCDLAVVLHFDAALARVSDGSFAEGILHQGLRARHVVVGYDFVYGQGRHGNAGLLVAAGARLGFGVTIVEPKLAAGGIAYSSTEIRQRLQEGRVEDAARLLGRPWEIEGRVEAGDRLGRELGFRTANLPLADYLRPAHGIYAVRVGIEGEAAVAWHDGVGYIGTRPAIGGVELRLEVNLFDFHGDLYGKHLRVQLIGWVRADRDFPDLDALSRQIAGDAHVARTMLAARQD